MKSQTSLIGLKEQQQVADQRTILKDVAAEFFKGLRGQLFINTLASTQK